MENFIDKINDHIEMCDHCGDNVINCECFKQSEEVIKSSYEKARCLWMKQMNEYNNLNWFKKLFIQKPQEPLIEDFI